MRTGIVILWLAFWGCLPLSAPTLMAATGSPLALASLSKRLSAIHSMSADFKQVLRDEAGALVQTSEGQMAWQRPDHFYWSITKPEKQLIVADGQWVWQYNPGLKQVQRHPIRHQAGTPMALLSGSVDQLGEQFDVVMQSERPFTYRLSPKNPEAPFRAIALTFVDDKLTHMRFEDALDQVTDFYFTKIKTNIKLPPLLFHFEPPAGASSSS